MVAGGRRCARVHILLLLDHGHREVGGGVGVRGEELVAVRAGRDVERGEGLRRTWSERCWRV